MNGIGCCDSLIGSGWSFLGCKKRMSGKEGKEGEQGYLVGDLVGDYSSLLDDAIWEGDSNGEEMSGFSGVFVVFRSLFGFRPRVRW